MSGSDLMDNERNSKYECSSLVIHEEIINKVKETLPRDEILNDLSQLFKVFGDNTRIKIIYSLSKEEMCVCDIAALLNMNQSAISHQLKVLRQSKLVKYRREGKVVYYSLDDEHIEEILKMGLLHISEGNTL